MSFGRWEPLDDAVPPAGPGLLQARSEGLLDYPTGKSAMIHYGADDVALESALARLCAILPPETRAQALVRFAPPEEREAPSATLEKYLRRFCDRFGAPPRFNPR